jgi:hypothetical protein
MARNARVRGAEARILNAAQWIDLVLSEWERELDALVEGQIRKRQRLQAMLLRLQTLSITSGDLLDVTRKQAAFDALYRRIRLETAAAIHELNRRYGNQAGSGVSQPSVN